ncbi:MAG: ABC transporter permease subunit [Dehalococcoidia bacterium]|nr:ABC transporter permease subunit [Dehalococcoidia bacterium]
MSHNLSKAARPANQTSVFVKRKRMYTFFFLGVIAIMIASSLIANFDYIVGIKSIPKAITWSLTKFIPNSSSWHWLTDEILKALFETALMSVAVTACSAVFAFAFSLLGTRTTKINPLIGRAVRIIASFFRNIPDVAWVLVLFMAFGQNILTGFFALFFVTFGLLTRTFIETIDEISASCVEALHASGANYMQVVFRGIIPSSAAALISWVLYMIETNIRNATLIGIISGTGIGFWFNWFLKSLNYGAAGLTLITIVVLVIAIEITSTQIRRAIL